VFALPLAIAGVIGLLPQVAAGASVTADFDGSGSAESARLAVSGVATELEITDASGRRIAHARLPVPPSRADAVAFSVGALGSAGALLEVVYPGPDGRTCRGVWRFREGRLTQLPVRGPEGPLPECPGADWTYRWERPDPKAPALYVRDRSQATPEGVARDVEAYAFSGFELAFAPEMSHRDVRGVAIPDWPDVVFYPRAPLEETLPLRFELSRLRSVPRLRIVASQAEHRFELRLDEPSGRTRIFPVCAATRDRSGNEVHLTGEAEGRTVRATIELGGRDETLPVEAVLLGLGPPLDDFYLPVLRREAGALRVYPSAEDEIAVQALPGRWSGREGEMTDISVVSGFPAVLRVAGQEVSLSIAQAPAGVDLLLVPRDGSPSTAGLILGGPDRMVKVPLACASSGACRIAGAPEPLRRAGARLN
jgi:hypothetical protein